MFERLSGGPPDRAGGRPPSAPDLMSGDPAGLIGAVVAGKYRLLSVLGQGGMGVVFEAPGAAHARGVIHRDIKPETIFLVLRPGRPAGVKLLDFGISKVLGADTRLTASNAVMGTPYFMAPEQALASERAGPPADLY